MAKEKGLIKKEIFSLCYSTEGGYITLGNITDKYHNGEIKYIPYYQGNMYKIKLSSYKVDNDTSKAISTNYYTVIDSGTTLTYLPSALFKEMNNKVKEYCDKNSNCNSTIKENCFKPKSGFSKQDVIQKLPTITFYLGDNKEIEMIWKPVNYITTDDSDYSGFCIGTYSWR